MGNCQRPHCVPECTTCTDTVEINITSGSQVMHFVVKFLGTTNQGLTWLYSVKKIGTKQDLSHFNLQLCFPHFSGRPQNLITAWRILELDADSDVCTGHVLASGTGATDNFKISPKGDPSIECASSLPLVKFDDLDDFDPVTSFCFEITLSEKLAVECAMIALKAGRISDCQCITGPSSFCHPLLTRGMFL